MSDLSELARRHLWMHFTRLGSYAEAEVPVMSRGEGCYVWDQHGKRYLDGLSGLFTVQVGHGRAEKHQVQHMIKLLLGLPAIPSPHDAADALAVAICHVHASSNAIASAGTVDRVPRSWRHWRPPTGTRPS